MHARKSLDRAVRLRTEARSLPDPLAAAYKRRAAELELEAHLRQATERVAVAA